MSPQVATQPCPPDLTIDQLMYQVGVWRNAVEQISAMPLTAALPVLIHPEVAQEIASLWGSSRSAFALFASHGEITDDLAEAIEEEIKEAERMAERATFAGTRAERANSIAALRALLAYVRHCEYREEGNLR